jgi:peptide/nickel transport system permease protein
VQIGVLSVLIACLLGLPVGVISALRPNSLLDALCSSGAVLFLAIPSFWLGLLIVAFLIIWFGYKAPITPVQLWHDPWANFQLVIGPAVVMGLGNAAQIARMSRSSLFEVLGEDYVRTARAKGLAEQVVLVRHALRTAILPVVTLSGLILGFAIGGSVAVEKAFAVPGLGRALVDAAVERDVTVVQNLVLLYALVFVAVNLLLDISYALLDPRVRLE